MKKLYALLILCFMNTIQADPLSDAIMETDIQKVSSLLSDHKPSSRQIMKYIDAAEQTIRLRRDNLVLCKGEIKRKTVITPSLLWMLGSYVSLIVSTGASLAEEAPNAKAIAGLTACVSFISLIASAVSLARCFEVEDIKQRYTHAVTIKGMLYDCSDMATTDLA